MWCYVLVRLLFFLSTVSSALLCYRSREKGVKKGEETREASAKMKRQGDSDSGSGSG